MSNPFENPNLFFDAEKHEYKNEKGEIYLSVSQLISKYKQPFDENGEILINCAKKRGITPEELQKEWDKTRDDACERGTSYHEQAEYFINTGKIMDGPDKDIIEQFAKIKFQGKIFPEVRLSSDKYKIAGTTDLVELFDDNTLSIYDWKTNRELKRFNPWKQRMLFPVDNFSDCNFNHYVIQLSLYAYILEEKGYWINNLTIYYINPKTRKIEIIPVENRRNDVKRILNHYNNIDEPIKRRSPFRLNQY